MRYVEGAEIGSVVGSGDDEDERLSNATTLDPPLLTSYASTEYSIQVTIGMQMQHWCRCVGSDLGRKAVVRFGAGRCVKVSELT